MNILYVSTQYPPSIGGAQIQLHCLAKAMKKAGHGVRAVTLCGRNRQDWLRQSTVFPEGERQYEYEGVEVRQIGFSAATRLKMAPWAAAYYLLLGPAARALSAYIFPDFERAAGTPLLVHATRIGREFIAMAALDFARKRNIPYILTPNHHPRWKGRLYEEYDKLYRAADAMIVYTPTEKETLVREKGVPEERVYVTGVGPVLSETFSAEKFRADNHLEGQRFVLYLGQQYRYKGIEAIVHAAPLVWQRYPDVRFVFIGPHTNDSRALFQNVHDPRIINLGTVDPDTKASALAACTFLCLPSMQESFGGVYAEAWCHHKAVIGGRIPPIAAVVDDGVNGILTSQEANDVANAIMYLLAHPSECEAMGDAGWRKVQDKYTWDQLASKTLAVYEKAVG